jgi:uncharacterized protein (TIGR03000 family)
MFRPILAVIAAALLTATADAQPRPLPLAPGVMRGSPWGPGMPFVRPTAAPRIGFGGGFSRGGVVLPGGAGYFPYLPYGYGYGYGGYGYGRYGFGGYGIDDIVTQPVPVAPPTPPDPVVVLAGEFPATLSLQFPAAAEVWVGGKKVAGAASEERVLISPVLKAGQNYTFDVKARWTSGGKTYEAKRNVTLGSGDRSRLLIVSGDEVRE